MALPFPTSGAGNSDPNASAPQVTQDGDPPNMQDAGKGGLFPKQDAPATRKDIGTVAGNSQRKPFNVK